MVVMMMYVINSVNYHLLHQRRCIMCSSLSTTCRHSNSNSLFHLSTCCNHLLCMMVNTNRYQIMLKLIIDITEHVESCTFSIQRHFGDDSCVLVCSHVSSTVSIALLFM